MRSVSGAVLVAVVLSGCQTVETKNSNGMTTYQVKMGGDTAVQPSANASNSSATSASNKPESAVAPATVRPGVAPGASTAPVSPAANVTQKRPSELPAKTESAKPPVAPTPPQPDPNAPIVETTLKGLPMSDKRCQKAKEEQGAGTGYLAKQARQAGYCQLETKIIKDRRSGRTIEKQESINLWKEDPAAAQRRMWAD